MNESTPNDLNLCLDEKGYDFSPKWPLASDKRAWLGRVSLPVMFEVIRKRKEEVERYESYNSEFPIALIEERNILKRLHIEDIVISPQLNLFYDVSKRCSGGPLEWIGFSKGLGTLEDLCHIDNLLAVLPEILKVIRKADSNKVYYESLRPSYESSIPFELTNIPEDPLEVLRGMQLIKGVLESQKELYVFRGVWQPISEGEIKTFLDAIGGRANTFQIIQNMRQDSRYSISHERLYPGKELSDDYHLVDHAGKVLDLMKAMKDAHYDVEPGFRPDLYLTNKIAARYDRRVSSRAIEGFLEEVTDNPEKDVPILQEWLGYNLLAKQLPIHKALMLVGPGRGGRSTYFEALELMLGKWNVSHVPLQRLGERFGLVNLMGKMANITPDIDSMPMQGTGKFKSISGGDTMDIERKGLPDIEGAFLPVKMAVGCNQVPYTPDKTIAFYDRPMIIELPYQFFDNPEEAEDPARAKKRVARKVDELVSHQAAGMLNLAIEGLGRLLDRGNFDYPYTDAANRERYERLAAPEDEVEEFVNECCIREPERSPMALWTGKKEVFASYKAWCSTRKDSKEKELKPMSLTALTRGLRVLGFPDGKGQRAYRGIALKLS